MDGYIEMIENNMLYSIAGIILAIVTAFVLHNWSAKEKAKERAEQSQKAKEDNDGINSRCY
jgi:hypothetical protein